METWLIFSVLYLLVLVVQFSLTRKAIGDVSEQNQIWLNTSFLFSGIAIFIILLYVLNVRDNVNQKVYYLLGTLVAVSAINLILMIMFKARSTTSEQENQLVLASGINLIISGLWLANITKVFE